MSPPPSPARRSASDSPWQEEPYKHRRCRWRRSSTAFRGIPKMHPCGVVLSRDPITALTPDLYERQRLRDHAF